MYNYQIIISKGEYKEENDICAFNNSTEADVECNEDIVLMVKNFEKRYFPKRHTTQ